MSYRGFTRDSLAKSGFDQLVVSLDLRFYRQLLCLNSARGKDQQTLEMQVHDGKFLTILWDAGRRLMGIDWQESAGRRGFQGQPDTVWPVMLRSGRRRESSVDISGFRRAMCSGIREKARQEYLKPLLRR